jgi:hypothetical protein
MDRKLRLERLLGVKTKFYFINSARIGAENWFIYEQMAGLLSRGGHVILFQLRFDFTQVLLRMGAGLNGGDAG